MASITIKRAKRFYHWAMDFEVFIDGHKVGSLENGQTKEFNTTVGFRQVYINLGRYSSPTISVEVRENQPTMLHVNLHKTVYTSGLAPVPAIFAYILSTKFGVENTALLDGLVALSIVLLLKTTYHLTKGRTRYLRLTEVK